MIEYKSRRIKYICSFFTGKESRENIEKQMQVMSDQKITIPTE